MDFNRSADLHYAYQFGEDAARSDYQAIRAEFEAKMGHDEEAVRQFEKGFADVRRKLESQATSANG